MMKEQTAGTLNKYVMAIVMFPVTTEVCVCVHAVCCCFLGSNVNWKGQFMEILVKEKNCPLLKL